MKNTTSTFLITSTTTYPIINLSQSNSQPHPHSIIYSFKSLKQLNKFLITLLPTNIQPNSTLTHQHSYIHTKHTSIYIYTTLNFTQIITTHLQLNHP